MFYDLVKFCQYVAPVFTPRTPSGDINFDIIPQYVDYLISTGVQGILVGGSCGEGALMSLEERILVARAFTIAVRSRVVVIVHTGGSNYLDTMELTAKVNKLDVDGVMLSAPVWYPYKNIGGLVEFIVEAGKMCPDKPVLFYHFPTLSNLTYDVVDFISKLKAELPNFIGLKFTDNDADKYKELVGLNVKVFLGFPSLAYVGVETQQKNVSFITGPNNYLNPLIMEIVNTYLRDETLKAKELQEELNDIMRNIIIEGELTASLRHMMEYTGVIVGPPAKPLKDLTKAQMETISSRLNKPGKSKETYRAHIKKVTVE